jgi:hypothetical protein
MQYDGTVSVRCARLVLKLDHLHSLMPGRETEAMASGSTRSLPVTAADVHVGQLRRWLQTRRHAIDSALNQRQLIELVNSLQQ